MARLLKVCALEYLLADAVGDSSLVPAWFTVIMSFAALLAAVTAWIWAVVAKMQIEAQIKVVHEQLNSHLDRAVKDAVDAATVIVLAKERARVAEERTKREDGNRL